MSSRLEYLTRLCTLTLAYRAAPTKLLLRVMGMWWKFSSTYFLDSPKSSSSTWLDSLPLPMEKFSGLRSRWRYPRECMYSRREMACCANESTAGRGSFLPLAVKICVMLGPTSSSTRMLCSEFCPYHKAFTTAFSPTRQRVLAIVTEVTIWCSIVVFSVGGVARPGILGRSETVCRKL